MLLLATEVWKSHGGIQRYMRMISQIISSHCEDQVAILTLLDDDDACDKEANSISTTCCRGNKWRFCLEAFRIARSGKARTTILGHVALLPLAWFLKTMKL